MDDPALDDHDESVRIAVRALGDMRSRAVSSSSATPSLSIASSSSSSLPSSIADDPSSPDFVNRVSHLPFVNSALRAYEQGKARSRVVKYGAEMMESSVKSISKPVIDRLPVNVNQLDEFACRQLDRLDRLRRSSGSDQDRMQTDASAFSENIVEDTTEIWENQSVRRSRSERTDLRRRTGGAKEVPSWLEATSPFVAPPPPPPDSRSPTPQPLVHQKDEGRHQVVQRSRWQAVLLEAGGLSAAVSEESMRRLKYCLQWLQYATAHIDAQILILRDFISALQQQPPSPSSPSPSSAPNSPSSNQRPDLQTLSTLRSDIIHTIRQVVDVVSKYAGASLPGEAKKTVRGLIMCLPQRWASASASGGNGGGVGTSGSGGAGERRASVSSGSAVAAAGSGGAVGRGTKGRREHKRERGSGSGNWVGMDGESPAKREEGGAQNQVATMQAAQKILTLATESLDMMRGVTGVVKDSLDRAETWVGRLRVVGLQSGATGDDSTDVDVVSGSDGKEGYGYHTPTSSISTSTNSTSASASTSEWSLPSTPGEPVDVIASAASPGAGVVYGIGELSLGGVGKVETQRKVEGDEGMDVDG